MSSEELSALACRIIAADLASGDHPLAPIFDALFAAEHGRLPTAGDLYGSSECPCCF